MGRLPNDFIPDPHVPQTEGSQIGDHRLSSSCGIVGRPNHNCGDDLVFVGAAQKSVGDRHSGSVCQSTSTTPERHGS